MPGAGPTNVYTCAVKDNKTLATELANASVLMIGDSTSAQLLWHTCEAYGVRPMSFIRVDAKAHNVSLKRYTHRLRSLDNHVCRLPGSVTFASFSHYGATGPPYWVFAYPLAPWLANTSLGMVRQDMPKFRRLTGGADPTVVIASSGFWDIASWWAHEGNFSKRWSLAATNRSATAYTVRYVAGVRRLVREVRRTFPNSLVVWRLMHMGMKHSITPKVVALLNDAIRSAAPAMHLPLLDTERIVASLSRTAQPNMGKGPPYGTMDGRHLHPFINLALLNLILNIATSARRGTAGGWHGWRAAIGRNATTRRGYAFHNNGGHGAMHGANGTASLGGGSGGGGGKRAHAAPWHARGSESSIAHS